MMSQKKINRITTLLLVVGLGSAIAVYFTAPPDEDDSVMRQIQGSKKYVREMRVMGGRANLVAAEFGQWFGDQWHGQNLAGTIAVLTVGSVLVFRFIATLPELPPAPQRSDMTPPSPPT